MNTSETAKPEGLRARKRRATENAIELSAVKLALEHGVENVTVEAICDMADISRSTFFNYFPARDYAIVGRAGSVPAEGDASAILDSSPDNLPLGIFRLIFASLGHRQVNAEVARLRGQLLEQQPNIIRMTVATLLEASYELTLAATAWLRAHPERQKLDAPAKEATLSVTLVHGMIAAQMSIWATAEGDTTAKEEEFLATLEDYRKIMGDI